MLTIESKKVLQTGLRWVLLLPIIALLMLLNIFFALLYAFGGMVMNILFLVCGFCALFFLFQQDWQLFLIDLVMAWAFSPLGLQGLMGLIVQWVAKALSACVAFANN